MNETPSSAGNSGERQSHLGQQGQGLTHRAVLLMAANVVAMLIAFTLPLLLVRTMSQSEYGLYKQAFQILLTALGMLNLQVAVSVFYFMAREPDKKLQVALNVLVFYLIIGTLLFLVFLAWPTWVTLIFKSADLAPHVPLLGFVILWWMVSTNLEGVPIAAGDVATASVLIVASQLSKAIIMISAALLFGSLTSILIASAIQGILQTIFMLTYIRRRFGRLLAPIDWPLFKAQMSNALPFGLGSITGIVQSDLHNYFVSSVYAPAQFAIYSVGCFQLPLLTTLSSSFASALNPDLASHKEAGDTQGIIRLWMDVVRKLAFFMTPAFVMMLVLRNEFITTLFTANYAGSVPIFAINLVNILLMITVHQNLQRLFDELKFFRFKLYLVLIPLTLGGLYLGWRNGGLVGIAVAVVAAQLLDAAATLAVTSWKLDLTWKDLRRLKPLLRIAAAAIAAGLVTSAVRLALLQTAPPVRLIVGAAVFGIVYMIAASILGAVTPSEQAKLREMALKYYAKGTARLRGAVTVE